MKAPALSLIIVRATGILASGTAVAQGLLFASALVLARLYSATDFGSFAIFMSFLAFDVTVCLGFDRGIAIARDVREARLSALLSVGTAMVVASLALLIFVGFRRSIGNAIGFPMTIYGACLIPAGLLTSGFCQIATGVAVFERRYFSLAATRVFQSAVAVACQILMVRLAPGHSSDGLATGVVLGMMVSAVTLTMIGRKTLFSEGLAVSVSAILSVARTLRRFSAYSLPASTLTVVTLQCSTYYVSASFGAEILGEFGFAQRLAAAPATLFAASMAQVFLAELSQFVRNGQPARTTEAFWITAKLQSLIGLAVMAAASAAPLYFPVLFGSRWGNAASYLLPLTVVTFGQLVAVPLYTITAVAGRQDLHLLTESARLALAVTMVIFARHAGATPITGIWIMALAIVLGYAMCFFVSLRIAQRLSTQQAMPPAQA